ncbi:MAG: GNAT family N-acetyltransferase [Leptolyngbya sp. SIO1D8]|nr:GNAT family N-acetyltransferase [Leptolyngbya sp. SIO1D8]
MIEWRWKQFTELTSEELYKILQIRQQVFIIEQQCIYPDIDDLDYDAWHLLGFSPEKELTAYLRVVAPGKKYQEPSIGRVLTHVNKRGGGLGRQLMEVGIQRTKQQFPQQGIRISAQTYLENFYRRLGFESIGEPYLEDDIPHIEMYCST